MTNHLDLIVCANCANDVNYYAETCSFCGETTDYKAPKSLPNATLSDPVSVKVSSRRHIKADWRALSRQPVIGAILKRFSGRPL